ncbi:MAG: glycosyltransferase family 2 protein [Sphingomicrobium sp.]
MMPSAYDINTALTAAFVVTQVLWLLSFLIEIYIFRLPTNIVDMTGVDEMPEAAMPPIVVFYPVLDELESTMHTTFRALSQVIYPRDKLRVIAIPNDNDHATIASLERLRAEFSFLEILPIPPTSDHSWDLVWHNWQANDHVYWWHRGPRAGVRDLPPKKTRQLIYAFYRVAEANRGGPDFLVNYIDADSCPQHNHFRAAAMGIQHYDVLQASNIAGNLNDTMAASFHAFDHMTWDGRKYAHFTADGTQPYWMLGKGLYYKASDLLELGGFHPWITIEDPEVGLRLWKNGRRLGFIEEPLIEEVPRTFAHGITQRKRWVAGFFQTLDVPLKELGFTQLERAKAWLLFLPCLSYLIAPIGIPVGIWAMVRLIEGTSPIPTWTMLVSVGNAVAYLISLFILYRTVWERTDAVLERKIDRVRYLLRCNPFNLMVWGLIWVIPIIIGWRMFLHDGGLVWERTVKVNANEQLIMDKSENHTL